MANPINTYPHTVMLVPGYLEPTTYIPWDKTCSPLNRLAGRSLYRMLPILRMRCGAEWSSQEKKLRIGYRGWYLYSEHRPKVVRYALSIDVIGRPEIRNKSLYIYIYIYLMWSVYKGSEVEWGVGLVEMFVIVYCIVRFTHCLVYLVVLNTDSSTLGSTRFWV